ncbi:MAG: tRNA1(Val) (adenine(37)-N6)-methyltransferase [Streptobacillus sp.]
MDDKYIVKISGFDLIQKKGLQSTTLDSLLLADFVRINGRSKNILDIGSGFGIISMILARKSKAKVYGVELNEESYIVSQENRKNAKLDNLEYINMDINNYKEIFKEQTFDIIVSNPPYFEEKNIENMRNMTSINDARFENTLSIKKVIDTSRVLLKNRASLYLIFRTERLMEILGYINGTNMKIKRLKPVYTKYNDDSSLISMIEIMKNVKSGFVMESPIFVYKNERERNEYITKLYE